jgi:hypothetical protein
LLNSGVERHDLGTGRDYIDAMPAYDTLEVKAAWQIRNPLRLAAYNQARTRVASECATLAWAGDPQLPAAYRATIGRFSGQPLHGNAGEVLLLHGTQPDRLHDILFAGLDLG